MQYRNVGRMGLKVSVISLGSVEFGGKLDEAESLRIVKKRKMLQPALVVQLVKSIEEKET